jgi:hypothetical protein
LHEQRATHQFSIRISFRGQYAESIGTLGGHVPDEVVVERRGAVQVVTINRPAVKNALNAGVAEAVAAAVDELDASDDLRVGVLAGSGGTFSAGMDLKAFLRGESPSIEGRGLCGITMTPPRKPLIGAVEGWALAGGSSSCSPVTSSSRRVRLAWGCPRSGGRWSPGRARPCCYRGAFRMRSRWSCC